MYRSERDRYQVAYAAGTDAGHRNMASEGRSDWNEADYCLAAAEMLRLMPDTIIGLDQANIDDIGD